MKPIIQDAITEQYYCVEQTGIDQSQDRHGKWSDTDLSIPFDKFCIKDPYLSNIF